MTHKKKDEYDACFCSI